MTRVWAFFVVAFALAYGGARPWAPVLVEDTAEGGPFWSNSIGSMSKFRAFAAEGSGFGAAGRVLKFIYDVIGGTGVYFIDANYVVKGKTPDFVQYHYNFAHKVLGINVSLDDFNQHTYFSEDKWWYAGTINSYELAPGDPPLVALQLYPDDVASEGSILEVVSAVAKVLSIPSVEYAFVASGPQQTYATIGPALKTLGWSALNVSSLLSGVTYLPLNVGEAYGWLRMFPQNQGNLLPTDIPFFSELPLDLSVVSGTITMAFQDVTSHVNLKSKERGTPNMVLRNASLLENFAGQPIHLIVSRTNFSVTLSSAQEVDAKMKARLNTPWQWLPSARSNALVWYDDMCDGLNSNCTGNAIYMGGKAAMLGFLVRVFGRVTDPNSISSKLGYDLTPKGWGVPLSFYQDIVAGNPLLDSALTALITVALNGTTNTTVLSRRVQSLFYNATVSQKQMQAMTQYVAQLAAKLPTKLKKLKVRSSANAEDIIGFDGAGLHDSFAVKLKAKDNPDGSCRVVFSGKGAVTKLKVEPATLQCAMKASFASLWNERAVLERTFSRIDHRSALMGLAVVPAYDTESNVQANGVIITRAINQQLMAYTVSVQMDNNLVTNPDPGTIAENTLAVWSSPDRPPALTVTRFAVPVANGTALNSSILAPPVMQLLVQLAQVIEVDYCRAKPGYYTNAPCIYVAFDPEKKRSMDIEFKLLENGEFVIKQAREFHGE